MVAETREPLFLPLQLARQASVGPEVDGRGAKMVLWTNGSVDKDGSALHQAEPCPVSHPLGCRTGAGTVRASLRIPYKHLPTGQPHPSQNGEQVAYCKLSGLDC